MVKMIGLVAIFEGTLADKGVMLIIIGFAGRVMAFVVIFTLVPFTASTVKQALHSLVLRPARVVGMLVAIKVFARLEPPGASIAVERPLARASKGLISARPEFH